MIGDEGSPKNAFRLRSTRKCPRRIPTASAGFTFSGAACPIVFSRSRSGGSKGLKPGFTLIEMLLVVLIFSLMSAALAQIFVNITRLQRKVANQAVLSQDMRFVTEMLVRAGRNNYVDYTGQPLAARSSDLKLTKPGGGSIWVTLKNSVTCGDPTVTNCLMMSTDGGASWNPVTSHKVDVTNFDVYVKPTSSPFLDTTINEQPMVTVNVGLKYMAENTTERATLQAQTTVSSRLYLR